MIGGFCLAVEKRENCSRTTNGGKRVTVRNDGKVAHECRRIARFGIGESDARRSEGLDTVAGTQQSERIGNRRGRCPDAIVARESLKVELGTHGER